jgi:hypothetical protein
VPDLRMIAVTSPRLAPKVPNGVEMHAFVPNLDRHVAAMLLSVGKRRLEHKYGNNRTASQRLLPAQYEKSYEAAEERCGRCRGNLQYQCDACSPESRRAMASVMAWSLYGLEKNRLPAGRLLSSRIAFPEATISFTGGQRSRM